MHRSLGYIMGQFASQCKTLKGGCYWPSKVEYHFLGGLSLHLTLLMPNRKSYSALSANICKIITTDKNRNSSSLPFSLGYHHKINFKPNPPQFYNKNPLVHTFFWFLFNLNTHKNCRGCKFSMWHWTLLPVTSLVAATQNVARDEYVYPSNSHNSDFEYPIQYPMTLLKFLILHLLYLLMYNQKLKVSYRT